MPTSPLDNLDTIAVIAGGFFAGTALYMTIGEVPAMHDLGLEQHWRFFPLMYERAAISQGIFAGIAGLSGILHGTRIIGSSFDRNLWITTGSIFFGIIPYTFICMLPTNKRIINDNKSVTLGNESLIDTTTKKDLLDKWAGLHLVRTVSSVVCFGAMAYGLSRHSSLLLK